LSFSLRCLCLLSVSAVKESVPPGFLTRKARNRGCALQRLAEDLSKYQKNKLLTCNAEVAEPTQKDVGDPVIAGVAVQSRPCLNARSLKACRASC
jgi:hypothetical protein